ncbi:MAG: cupin domain-containing protein [Planctomycetales bacterium]|nr:cupin domain-containing protein [Planctomycetales bacterium]
MSNIRYGSGGGIYRIVTTTAQTGGIHFALDCTEKPGGGPPLHIHETEEEYFFVTEGEFTFSIDGKITKAKAGESAFVPRGMVHCFKNCTNQDARMLVLFTPGNIEGYFDFGLPLEDGSIPSEACLIERMNAIGPKFNVIQVEGPSPF